MLLADVRVLLVEDNEDLRLLFALVLTEAGAVVKSAASASEALALLADFAPELVVSNICMPEIDGYTLLRQLRAGGLSVPALALTGYASSRDREEALSAGFTEHLIKPVEVDELVTTVTRLLHRDRNHHDGAS